MSDKVREAKRAGDAVTEALRKLTDINLDSVIAAMIERTSAVCAMACVGSDPKETATEFVDAIAEAVTVVIDKKKQQLSEQQR